MLTGPLLCFNRTFMELKSNKFNFTRLLIYACFNRTFMELKSGIRNSIT